MKSSTRRVFIAIPAPSEIHDYLQQLKEANHDVKGIKWMRSHNLHLTIYFLGNIKTEDFEKVVTTITPIISSQKKFTIEFEKTCLAPEKDPRMIWVRFYKNTEFTHLANVIHDSLKSIVLDDKNFYKEPFPHITLARFHPIKKLENFNFTEFTLLPKIQINSCELWESIPSEEGVKYVNVAPIFYLSK